jgi:hypothetical protein
MKTIPLSPGATLEDKLPRVIALFALTIVTLLALSGCQGSRSISTDTDSIGVYTLVSVDGKSLPSSLTHEGTAMVVKSGTFTLNADGTCRTWTVFSVPPNTDVSREAKATYTRNGTELTMKWENAGTTQGRLDGNKFTLSNEGMVFGYQK